MVDRKSCKIISCILCLMFFIACGKKEQLNPNSLFSYEDLTDSYDSNTTTFTRRYNDDTIKIKVMVTQDEKKHILQSFSENNFQNFPKRIDCSSWGVSPKIYDELTLDNLTVQYVHNVKKSFFCTDGKRFNEISILIKEIILNKPEVKKLEMSDISYE